MEKKTIFLLVMFSMFFSISRANEVSSDSEILFSREIVDVNLENYFLLDGPPLVSDKGCVVCIAKMNNAGNAMIVTCHKVLKNGKTCEEIEKILDDHFS